MRRGQAIKWGVSAVLVFVLFLTLESTGWAQYPTKEINMIVGFPPEGATDIAARGLCEPASKTLRQPMLVINKPGASSAVGLSFLKNQKPDGYTLGTITVSGVIAQHMNPNAGYDFPKDFTPIMGYGENVGGIVVRADSPWKTLKEFIDYAKANPGKIKFSSTGVGSIHHLLMEALGIQEGIKWTHIPFAGVQSVPALLGGHVDMLCTGFEPKPHVIAGKLRYLAMYSKKRVPIFPDVPTLIELGYNISGINIAGIAGPKGIPKPIVDILHRAFKEAMDDAQLKKMVVGSIELDLVYRTPEELADYYSEYSDQARKLILQLGLK